MNVDVQDRPSDSIAAQGFEPFGLEHERLVDSAGILEALLPDLDEPAAAAAFLAHFEFVHEFCELLHFPMEDAQLEVILEAGLTPSERRVVFLNLAQHQQLYAEAVGVLGCFGHSQMPSDAQRCRETATRYVASLRAHLEFEARHLQPLLRRYLSGHDASRIESARHNLAAMLVGQPLARLTALDAAARELRVAR